MKTVSTSLILAATAVLGACSHYENDLSALDKSMKAQPAAVYAAAATPQDIAPAAGTPAESFNSTLAHQYYDLAKFENDKAFDYKAAKAYTEKAVAAAKGQTTEPSKIASYDVPDDQKADLIEARQNLIAALKTENAPGNEASLAKAQTSFDCWLERSEEATDPSHYSDCKTSFDQSMAQLVMPAAGTQSAAGVMQQASAPMSEIAFAPNSAAIDATAEPSLAQIAGFLSQPQNAGYSAIITGFTNATAPSPAGTQLATDRALKVREILVGKGVSDAMLKPQIASVAQAAGIIPASTGDITSKVQIHLIAPAGAPITAGTTVTTTSVTTTPQAPDMAAPVPSIYAPSAPAAAPMIKPSSKTTYN